MRNIYPSFITNGQKILFEEIIGLISLFVIGFSILHMSLLQIGYWIIPFGAPFLAYTTYKLVQNRNSLESEASYAPTGEELMIISIFWLLCSGISLYKIQLTSYFTASVPILLSSLYLYRLHLVNQLYSADLIFYTDRYSLASNEWAEASATLTKSLKLQKQNNIFSILWATVSIGRYIRLYNSVDANRNEYDLQGAEDYVFAAKQNLKVCIKEITGAAPEENIYLFNTSISRAEDKLSISRCDSCSSVHRVDNMTRVLSNKDIEEKILCTDCDSEYIDVECPNCNRTVKKSERVNKYCIYCEPLNQYKTSSRRTRSQKYRSIHKDYSHDESKTILSTNMGHTGEIETAMAILGIEEPMNRDKVIRAYRGKTKVTHPDIDTGSEEAFKKVREAKTTLLEELNER